MTTRYARLDEIPKQARVRIRLTGPDTVRFLHGTVTADVQGISEGQAVAAGLLTVKGKLVSELVVLGEGEYTVDLLVPGEQGEPIAELLDRHIIMDDVELQRLGPTAAALAWNEDRTGPTIEAEGTRSFVTRHPAPGTLVIGEPEAVELAMSGARKVGAGGFDAYRIETGTPAWGHELAPDFFPPEVGFVYAVSYDKGCYLGQEPLARIHARGQVNRVMVRVEADRLPSEAADLVHPERSDAGRWTTFVSDGGRARGLAIVRRQLASPGTVLKTEGDAPIEVRVVSNPIGDDPGVGGRTRPQA